MIAFLITISFLQGQEMFQITNRCWNISWKFIAW